MFRSRNVRQLAGTESVCRVRWNQVVFMLRTKQAASYFGGDYKAHENNQSKAKWSFHRTLDS